MRNVVSISILAKDYISKSFAFFISVACGSKPRSSLGVFWTRKYRDSRDVKDNPSPHDKEQYEVCVSREKSTVILRGAFWGPKSQMRC